MYEGDGWMWGHGWGWGIPLGVLVILVVAVLVTAIALAIRYLSAPQQTPGPPADRTQDRSELILAERFARGEIDEDEYRRRIAVLRDSR